MKKIPCLFQRDFSDKRNPVLLRDVTPGCEWVLAGEGVATRKWDGTACRVSIGWLYARYDAKRGKPPPVGWDPCDDAPDPVTGHWPGWILVGFAPQWRWHRMAWDALAAPLPDGTYELVGPAVNANHDGEPAHVFRRHGDTTYPDAPRTWDGLREWLSTRAVEGLVFHHQDGRMCKIRRADYGFAWPVVGVP